MNGQNQFGGSGSGGSQNSMHGDWATGSDSWAQPQDTTPPTSSFGPVTQTGMHSPSHGSQPSQFGPGAQPGMPMSGGQPPYPPAGQIASANGGGHRRGGGAKVGVLTATALVLLGGGLGGAVGGALASNGNSNVVNSLKEEPKSGTHASPEGSIEAVAEKVLPSVVSIIVEAGSESGQGSGSVLSSDGLVLTNNHVIAAAEKNKDAMMVVRLNDGSVHPADLVAGDPSSDIAVIKIRDVHGLTPIQLGNSDDLKVGQEVVAIGSPLGLTSTVTSGIVSAKNRPVRAGGENGSTQSIIDAIQTDAAINPGNSGGPLVDLAGNLVGINSVISTTSEKSGSIGLGFSIPINQGRRIADELVEKGKATRSVINAQIESRPTVLGAKIVKVIDGGAADRAGLKSGDIVVRIGDRSISDGDGLIAAIRSHQVGETVKLTVVDGEGGNEHDVDVTIEAASD